MKYIFLKKHKKYILILGVIILLIIMRMMLPHIILKKTNNYLASFSPIYVAKVQDVELRIISATCFFKKFELIEKNKNKNILDINTISISFVWKSLLESHLLMDIKLQNAKIFFYKQSSKTAKKTLDKEKNIPFIINRLTIENSTLHYAQKANASDAQHLNFYDLNAYIENLIPEEANSISKFQFNGKLPPKATLKIIGQAKFFRDPIDWNVDLELKNFFLPSANGFLSTIPLTFNKGILEMVAEIKSENDSIEGYVKPFFKDVDIVGDEVDFVGGKHFLVEIFSSFGNFIFKNPDTDTVASKIYFKKDNKKAKVKINSKRAISSALKYEDKKEHLKPIINKEVELK